MAAGPFAMLFTTWVWRKRMENPTGWCPAPWDSFVLVRSELWVGFHAQLVAIQTHDFGLFADPETDCCFEHEPDQMRQL